MYYLSEDVYFVVKMTNNVVYDEQGHARAALGRSWQSIPNVRLELSCDSVTQANGQVTRSPHRNAKLIKSQRQVYNYKYYY